MNDNYVIVLCFRTRVYFVHICIPFNDMRMAHHMCYIIYILFNIDMVSNMFVALSKR